MKQKKQRYNKTWYGYMTLIACLLMPIITKVWESHRTVEAAFGIALVLMNFSYRYFVVQKNIHKIGFGLKLDTILLIGALSALFGRGTFFSGEARWIMWSLLIVIHVFLLLTFHREVKKEQKGKESKPIIDL